MAVARLLVFWGLLLHATLAVADKVLFLPTPADSTRARIALPLENDEIRVSVYEAFEDEASLMQLSILREAARRGKKVRLLLDGVGARSLSFSMLRQLESDGVRIKIFHPLPFGSPLISDYFAFHKLTRRDHDKLYIASPAGRPADGEMLTGSRNFGDDYFGLGPHPQRDVDVYYRGAEVKRAADYFDGVWESAAVATPHLERSRDRGAERVAAARLDQAWRKVTARRDFKSPADWRSKAREISDVSFSHGAPNPVRQNVGDLVALINRARESLFLVSPYVIPGGPIWTAIERAIARGVKVRLFTNSLASSRSPAQQGYEQWIPRIAEMGLEVWEYQPAGQKLHAKAIVVDGRETYLGSSNLDRRSLRLQTESGLFIKDEGLAAEVTRYFERHLEHASLVARGGVLLKAGQCRSLFRRLLSAFLLNQL